MTSKKRGPKLKTHKASASRIHITGGGKLMRLHGHRSHFRRRKTAAVKRLFEQKEATGASRPLELEGISVEGRLVLVYSKNDLVSHLKQVSDPFGNGYDADTCRETTINLVAYAMQN